MYSGWVRPINVEYWGVSPRWTAAGDRRRFGGFALRQTANVKVAPPHRDKQHDVTVFTLGADLTTWREVKATGSRLVVDIVDSYLHEPKVSIRALGRGLYKSMKGDFSRYVLRYGDLLKEVIENADAVVCASLEQRATLMNLNENVHSIVDCLDELFSLGTDPRPAEGDSKSVETNRLLWEGLAVNLKHFAVISDEINRWPKKENWVLDVATNMNYKVGGVMTRNTNALVRKIPMRVELWPWSLNVLEVLGKNSPVGIIPLNHEDPMAWAKSENKLLGFWALGLPVLVSATPSYSRVASLTSNVLSVVQPDDWAARLSSLEQDLGLLRDEARRGRSYALREAGHASVDAKWRDVFRSINIDWQNHSHHD